jgi:hypothetical protein
VFVAIASVDSGQVSGSTTPPPATGLPDLWEPVTIIPLVTSVSERGGDYPFLIINQSEKFLVYPSVLAPLRSGTKFPIIDTFFAVNAAEQGTLIPLLGANADPTPAAILPMRPGAQYLRKITLPPVDRRVRNRLAFGKNPIDLRVSRTIEPLALAGDLGIDRPYATAFDKHWDCESSMAAYGTRYAGKQLRLRKLRPTATWSKWTLFAATQCNKLNSGLYEISTVNNNLGYYFGIAPKTG